MSDDEQLDLITSPASTVPMLCYHCGREMLVTKASLAAAESAPRARGFLDRATNQVALWIGVTAYVETPEHRVLRAVVALGNPGRILCTMDCRPPRRDAPA